MGFVKSEENIKNKTTKYHVKFIEGFYTDLGKLMNNMS